MFLKLPNLTSTKLTMVMIETLVTMTANVNFKLIY